MGRQRKRRKWINPIELGGLVGVIVLLLILSTSWVLDIGEAKNTDEVTTQQKENVQGDISPEVGGETPVESEAEEAVKEVETNDEDINTSKGDYTSGDEAVEEAGNPSIDVEEPQAVDNEKTVYLTFDDGPNENTEAILQLLDQYDAKATFFMLEPNMRRYHDAVQHMAKEGHSVGMHGVTHDVSQFYQSSESVTGEMLKAQATLESITGIHSDLIRVPYGSVPNMKPEYIQAVNNEGFKLWDWNIDSEDWRFRSGKYVQNVMDQLAAYPYGTMPKIILMHEQKETLSHLEALLQKLTNQGYSMKALTEQMKPVTFMEGE